MPQTTYRSNLSEYMDAMGVVRAAKNVLFILVLVAILAPLAGFVLYSFTDLLDPMYTPVASAADANSAPDPNTVVAQTQKLQQADMLRTCFNAVLGAAKIVAPALTGLLLMTLLLGVMVLLVGRLGGAAGLCGAFFWTLALGAILVPWEHKFPDASVCGALYTLDELAARGQDMIKGSEPVDTMELMLFYARFVGYPVIALLFWIVVQIRFARGYRRMVESTAVTAQTQPPGPTGGSAEAPERLRE